MNTDVTGPANSETLAEKAAKWDRIAAAWNKYRTEGAGAFDWDYDSRDLMLELTGPAQQDPQDGG